MRGVKSVLAVKLPTPAAAEARSVASSMVTWIQEPQNMRNFCSFAENLVAELSTCLPSPGAVHSQSRMRERMWHLYHRLRVSDNFKRKWAEFIQISTQQPAHPAFYQHVSDVMLEELIRKHFPLGNKPNTSKDTTITMNEANVIRYAAGYTLRRVRKKVEASSHHLKEEMVLCIMDLLADEDDMELEDETTEWTTLVDRGGLWHVKPGTFHLFCAIEEELRSYFKVSGVKEISDGARDTIVRAICSSDDVAFYWCMLCTDGGDEEKDELLLRIVNLWVTIRGFSFARSWMEMYKQANKKGTQRAKALRKDLH